jgi:hypothetical protein
MYSSEKEVGQFIPLTSVQNLLNKRAVLLATTVVPLAHALKYHVFQDYTCERAQLFFTAHVRPLWQAYLSSSTAGSDEDNLPRGTFPFTAFLLSYLGMQDVEELFGGSDQTFLTRERAHELWQMIEAPFRELHSILPFEALRNDRERARYLL